MDRQAFIRMMETIAPPELAEEFDAGKIGLIVEGKPRIEEVCCALDATPAVVMQAIDYNADMLVVHHTPLWNPVTALTGKTASLMRSILQHQLNLYVMHTNFDLAPGGVNDSIADLLDLDDTVHMSLGLVGTCKISPEEISRRLGVSLRIWGTPGRLDRLAIAAGSAFDPLLLEEAARLGADAFLSSELKHSVARSTPIPCIEATHYALEAPAMHMLAEKYGWHYIDDPPILTFCP